VTPTPWRVPQYWLLVATSVLLGTWLVLDLPYLAVVFALYSVALVALGRQIERDAQIHRKLKATVRPRPIVAARAATELNLRRIPHAHLPDLPPPVRR
jgi:hypothetical protein